MSEMNFSVLISVYAAEKIDFFRKAMNSVLNQTLMPSEIVLIRDGEVPQGLQNCIDEFLTLYPELFKYIPLEKNVGLGRALNIGVESSSNDLIIRMDSDDICVPERFELQVSYMKNNPEIAVLGGQIEEFEADELCRGFKREVPTEHNLIVNFMKTRNPFNHMTVAFRKKAVLDAGNYLEMHYAEDYYLWCRMLLNNETFANLPDTLVFARTGGGMFQRRGGIKYFLSLKRLEDFKLKHKLINFGEYAKTIMIRFILQVVFTKQLREFVMKKFARTNNRSKG